MELLPESATEKITITYEEDLRNTLLAQWLKLMHMKPSIERYLYAQPSIIRYLFVKG